MLQFVHVKKKLCHRTSKKDPGFLRDAFAFGSVSLALEVRVVIFSWALSQLKAD